MTPFEEGVLAYSEDKELIDNPYRGITDFQKSERDWNRGFQQAEQDDPFKPETDPFDEEDTDED